MTSIYILHLTKGRYYIGKARMFYGSAWTRKYKPLSLVKTIEQTSPFDEDKITKEYMSKYGIENVRGGSYVEIELSEFHFFS